MYELDKYLDTVKRIHFIGIGGSGMCPLAEILHTKGYEITGSDNNETDTLKRVRALGIKVYMGQRAENIEGAELIVYTAAIMADNPELIAAKESGIPTFERSKLLGAISRKFSTCVGISGTHGKTTTTSMLTQLLIEAGMNPNAVIGGKLPLTGTNGITGSSDIFVCESCEFSNTFLQLSPSCSVILNIDNDHLEFFKTMENLKKSFTEFANLSSTVIYNGDDENTLDAVKNVDSDKTFVTFGLNKSNDWHADNIEFVDGAFAKFDIYNRDRFIGNVTLGVPGEHNIYNALAVFASLDYLGADMSLAVKNISHFKGAGRRFEELADIGGIKVIDDYAHHPTELEATLKTAKKQTKGRVIAVFQPFTFSRTYKLMDDFARVLKIADKVIMTEIMGSREKNTYNVYTADLAKKIEGSEWYNTFDEVAKAAERFAQPGDIIITLGCGDIYKAAKIIIQDLSK